MPFKGLHQDWEENNRQLFLCPSDYSLVPSYELRCPEPSPYVMLRYSLPFLQSSSLSFMSFEVILWPLFHQRYGKVASPDKQDYLKSFISCADLTFSPQTGTITSVICYFRARFYFLMTLTHESCELSLCTQLCEGLPP